MTYKDVLETVLRDRTFFAASGGGMTISGGEPIAQGDFTRQLLEGAKDAGISTCIETSLYGSFETIKMLIPLLDHILFDVKHWDGNQHQRSTGVDNHIIMENIRFILQMRPDAVARIPVIPGFNDSEEDIKNIASHLKSAGVGRVELLPYHNLAASKYSALGREYKYFKIPALKEDVFQRISTAYKNSGLDIS
jgi:pyruvate formate lyase activating enzyme